MRPNIVTADNTMPAGEYYIGDLCYVMHDQWDEVCNIIIQGRDIVDGVFTLKDGTRFAILSTHYGDGCYSDQFGTEYCVDSGSIGCVLWSVAEKDQQYSSIEDLGGRVTFDTTFNVSGDQRGLRKFGHVEINTGFSDEEEDEYEE